MGLNYKDNFDNISDNIAKYSKSWKQKYPKVLVVTKKRSRVEIESFILQTQHNVFGENYVQEAQTKYIDLKQQFLNIKLHLIGHLQSNKAKDAVKLFDVIETVDSFKLAKKLDDAEKLLDLKRQYLIQVNIGSEPQKSGVNIDDLSNLIKDIRSNLNINLIGLMCVPPKGQNPSIYFAMLKNLARIYDLRYLSMGMSSDYKDAIAVGSDEVRIGSLMFA
ncbi:MAG: YggS family pyridoxal phosphate-dependent enzyme [Rickettsiales bacterium]|nr:YggS family pyridoxal phosphate-dependent enzyme [Rickettsiales bacterium]